MNTSGRDLSSRLSLKVLLTYLNHGCAANFQSFTEPSYFGQIWDVLLQLTADDTLFLVLCGHKSERGLSLHKRTSTSCYDWYSVKQILLPNASLFLKGHAGICWGTQGGYWEPSYINDFFHNYCYQLGSGHQKNTNYVASLDPDMPDASPLPGCLW